MEIEVKGGRVEVELEGKGPPIVLVHSLFTDARSFDLIVPALASRHVVCRVSLPGFGRSTPLEQDKPGIGAFADLLAGVLVELELGPDTAVLGNGLGGSAAVALAIRYGERFGKLVATSCGAVFSFERAAGFGTMSRLVEEGGMEAVVDAAVRRMFPVHYLEQHPEVIEERREALIEVDPGAFGVACRALAAMDLRSGLGSIRNPTLVIVGADDETTPPKMAEELADGIRDARRVVLSDCGHCPQLQQPAALLAAVESFLGSPVPGPHPGKLQLE